MARAGWWQVDWGRHGPLSSRRPGPQGNADGNTCPRTLPRTERGSGATSVSTGLLPSHMDFTGHPGAQWSCKNDLEHPGPLPATQATGSAPREPARQRTLGDLGWAPGHWCHEVWALSHQPRHPTLPLLLRKRGGGLSWPSGSTRVPRVPAEPSAASPAWSLPRPAIPGSHSGTVPPRLPLGHKAWEHPPRPARSPRDARHHEALCARWHLEDVASSETHSPCAWNRCLTRGLHRSWAWAERHVDRREKSTW